MLKIAKKLLKMAKMLIAWRTLQVFQANVSKDGNKSIQLEITLKENNVAKDIVNFDNRLDSRFNENLFGSVFLQSDPGEKPVNANLNIAKELLRMAKQILAWIPGPLQSSVKIVGNEFQVTYFMNYDIKESKQDPEKAIDTHKGLFLGECEAVVNKNIKELVAFGKTKQVPLLVEKKNKDFIVGVLAIDKESKNPKESIESYFNFHFSPVVGKETKVGEQVTLVCRVSITLANPNLVALYGEKIKKLFSMNHKNTFDPQLFEESHLPKQTPIRK